MPSAPFYPSVSNLISTSQLPMDKIPFTGNLSTLMDQLFYRNLLVSKSTEGDAGFYALEILSYKEIGFGIPGTEMKFLINPDLTPGGAATTFPLSLNYQWPILKVVRDFNFALFSGNPTDYFDLMAKYLGITYTDIIDGVIQSFAGNNDSAAKFYGKYFLTKSEYAIFNANLDLSPNNATKSNYPNSKIFYGPGGNYLSNEIFYRVSRSRENNNSSVKTGHYHLANNIGKIPPPISKRNPTLKTIITPSTYTTFTLVEIITEVENSIKRALNGL